MQWADQNRRWVMVAIVVVYLAGFNAHWRLEPDSALYLSVGQNLADGHGYTFQGRPHRLAYPGYPLLVAATFKATAPFTHHRTLVPALIVMLAIGLCCLGLTYRLFLLAAGRPTAVVVTAGVALSRIFYRYNFELLSELPFLLGVMAFLVGYEAVFNRGGATNQPGRRWFDWVLLIGGLAVAIATRPAMWALVFAVVAATALWLLAGLFRGNIGGGRRWGQILICAGVIGAVALFYFRDPRHAEHHAGPNAAATQGPGYAEEDELLEMRGDRIWNLVRRAVGHTPALMDAVTKASFGLQVPSEVEWFFGSLMLLLGGILTFQIQRPAVKAEQNGHDSAARVQLYRPLWGMLIVMTTLMVLLVKPLDRYFLPVAPLLVFAWWRFSVWVNRKIPGRWGNLAFAFLFILGASPNGAKVFGFAREQRQSPFTMNYKEGRYASISDAAKLIAAHTPPSLEASDPSTTWVVVGPKLARILTFLSGRYAIEPEPWCNLDPDHQPVFLLDPSWPLDARDAAPHEGERVGVEKWLADHHLQRSIEPIARVLDKDPRLKGSSWTLYRLVRAPNGRPAPAERP